MILVHWNNLKKYQIQDTTAPTVPTSLTTSSVSDTEITLSWTASTDNIAVTGYDLQLNGTYVTTVTGTSYTFTGLTASTSYTLGVRAKDAAGNTSSYATINQSTTATPTGITFVKGESVVPSDSGGDDATTHTITGIQSGDFILGFASDSAGGAPATPTGATNIYEANLFHNSSAFYDFSTGTSITFNSLDGDSLHSFVVFRGVNSTTPLDVSITAPSSNSGNVNTITPPSITTVTDECMIVLLLTIEDEATLEGNVTFDSSYTNGEEHYALSPDTYNLMVYKTQTTAGTETPSAFSWSPTDEAHTTTIALRPA